MSHLITLIPGDGIGPEVTAAVVRIFKIAGVEIDWERHDAGVTAFKLHNQSLPGTLLDSIRRNKVALKGPVTTPIAEGFTSVNVGLRKALDLYEREKLAYIGQALEQPTARKVAEFMLRGALENATGGDGGPHGCLRVTAAVACGEGAESIRCEIMERTRSGKDNLVARFERAKSEGDLPAHVDPEGLTRVLIAFLQGISVQANMGEPRAELEKLVDTALDLWPSA